MLSLLFTASAFLHSPVLNRPPLGSKYEAHVNFILIGQQKIHLHITSMKTADITLSGIINSKSTINYNMNYFGKIDFEMTISLQQILNKYHVRINDILYIPDFAQITVFVKPIHYKKKIILDRILT